MTDTATLSDIKMAPQLAWIGLGNMGRVSASLLIS